MGRRDGGGDTGGKTQGVRAGKKASTSVYALAKGLGRGLRKRGGGRVGVAGRAAVRGCTVAAGLRHARSRVCNAQAHRRAPITHNPRPPSPSGRPWLLTARRAEPQKVTAPPKLPSLPSPAPAPRPCRHSQPTCLLLIHFSRKAFPQPKERARSLPVPSGITPTAGGGSSCGGRGAGQGGGRGRGVAYSGQGGTAFGIWGGERTSYASAQLGSRWLWRAGGPAYAVKASVGQCCIAHGLGGRHGLAPAARRPPFGCRALQQRS